MSQENVELVRRALQAWAEVDSGRVGRERLEDFFAPDGPWKFVGGPEEAEFRGVDQFLEFRSSWSAPYDEWGYEVERILAAGADRVVATLYQRGRLRGSESWVDLRYGIVYTIGSGLIQRAEIYGSADQALEAVGLRE